MNDFKDELQFYIKINLSWSDHKHQLDPAWSGIYSTLFSGAWRPSWSPAGPSNHLHQEPFASRPWGRNKPLAGCSFNQITPPPVQTGHARAVSRRALSPSAEARKTATCCGFKAAARLAHATTSYSSAEQTAATQRKLCFNVIRGWSSSNDAVFPCLSDSGLMASISRP